MAGVMLVAAGFMRFGTWIKYIPEPVVTGFTAGIAVIIFTSQLKDIFGLAPADLPAEFLPKLSALWQARATFDAATFAVAAAALAVILLRSEAHTSELQSLMRISYAVFCLKKTIN